MVSVSYQIMHEHEWASVCARCGYAMRRSGAFSPQPPIGKRARWAVSHRFLDECKTSRKGVRGMNLSRRGFFKATGAALATTMAFELSSQTQGSTRAPWRGPSTATASPAPSATSIPPTRRPTCSRATPILAPTVPPLARCGSTPACGTTTMLRSTRQSSRCVAATPRTSPVSA